jgi:hypothetical protein
LLEGRRVRRLSTDGEEILIGGAGFRNVTGNGLGAGEAKMRERAGPAFGERLSGLAWPGIA